MNIFTKSMDQLLGMYIKCEKYENLILQWLLHEVSLIRFYIGQEAHILITDLEILKQIMVKDFNNFMDREVSSLVKCFDGLIVMDSPINLWSIQVAKLLRKNSKGFLDNKVKHGREVDALFRQHFLFQRWRWLALSNQLPPPPKLHTV